MIKSDFCVFVKPLDEVYCRFFGISVATAWNTNIANDVRISTENLSILNNKVSLSVCLLLCWNQCNIHLNFRSWRIGCYRYEIYLRKLWKSLMHFLVFISHLYSQFNSWKFSWYRDGHLKMAHFSRVQFILKIFNILLFLKKREKTNQCCTLEKRPSICIVVCFHCSVHLILISVAAAASFIPSINVFFLRRKQNKVHSPSRPKPYKKIAQSLEKHNYSSLSNVDCSYCPLFPLSGHLIYANTKYKILYTTNHIYKEKKHRLMSMYSVHAHSVSKIRGCVLREKKRAVISYGNHVKQIIWYEQ